MTKPDINEFWIRQPFRLLLTSYQGNCKWCWKKSLRKLLTIMAENPEKFDFPERMDALYGKVGAEFNKAEKPPYEFRTMFRGNISTRDLRAAYDANKEMLEKAVDDAIILPRNLRLFPLDAEEGGCTETCEITA